MDCTALVGRWIEEDNPVLVSTIVLTISIRGGRFHVCAIDESDWSRLRVSSIRWDGDLLQFKTFYSPTGHRTEHNFRVVGKGRARLRIRYSDEDGRFSIDENWRKVTR
jgi:hypothetical protein